MAFLYLQDPEGPLRDPSRVGGGLGVVPFSQLERLRQETKVKMHLDQERLELEQKLKRNQLHPGARRRAQFHDTPLEMADDPRGFILSQPGEYKNLTLEQKMDALIAARQEYEQMEQMQRRAYVEQFITEARKMGFEVKLTHDLEVESIRKLKSH